MKIRQVSAAAAARGDAVFVLAGEGAGPDGGRALQQAVAAAKATGDLKASFRAVSVFHQPPKSPCKRLCFVGVGKVDQMDTERLRRAAAIAQLAAAELGVDTFSLLV